jgi:hypothetical protein
MQSQQSNGFPVKGSTGCLAVGAAVGAVTDAEAGAIAGDGAAKIDC